MGHRVRQGQAEEGEETELQAFRGLKQVVPANLRAEEQEEGREAQNKEDCEDRVRIKHHFLRRRLPCFAVYGLKGAMPGG